MEGEQFEAIFDKQIRLRQRQHSLDPTSTGVSIGWVYEVQGEWR